LIQFIVQVLIEIVAEWLLQTSFRGAVRVARSRTGRLSVGGLVGLAFGFGWGVHLGDNQTWPRLLWISLVLAAGAAVLAVGRAGTADQPDPGGRRMGLLGEVALPPWRWGGERLAGFAVINLGIAAGIFGALSPARLF
jgi:hypothetical protein